MSSQPSEAVRTFLAARWDDAWREGLWAAAWSKSVGDLTAQQAAWRPESGRHSIWQIVLHMVFWREDALRRIRGGPDVPKPTEEQLRRLNFPEITDVTEPAWGEARRRLQQSQEGVSAALRDPGLSAERLSYLLPHDCYHFGQINYLRAMLGLKPIE